MTSQDFVTYAAYAIGSIIFLYILLRWIFSIGRRNRLLAAQVSLLAKIAEKQGVNNDDIDKIVNDAKTHFFWDSESKL